MIKLLSFFALFSVAFCSIIKLNHHHENIPKALDFESDKNANDNFKQDLSTYNENYPKLARFRPQERDLNKDLSDFLSLIDVQAVISTFMEHLEDPEVMEAVAFFLSPEFKEMVLEFEAIPEFKQALSFLTSKGYDPTPALEALHDLLSIPPLPGHYKRSGGVTALIQALIQALPVADLKALLREKLSGSAEFADLYATVTSDELKEILDRMTYNDSFVAVKSRLERLGFDFVYLRKLVVEIFALE